MEDPEPILCFKHCQAGATVLCLGLPEVCPVCKEDIDSASMKIPPFRAKSPLSSAEMATHSIVIKPTVGSFLRDYTKAADLHVGITDSYSRVFHYNQAGVTIDNGEEWGQVIAVRLQKEHVASLPAWDSILQQVATQPAWSSQRYDEDKHNCYDFVLACFAKLGIQGELTTIINRLAPEWEEEHENPSQDDATSSAYELQDKKDKMALMLNKTTFCEKLIVPQTTRAAKYITLFRKLLEDEVVIQYNTTL